MDPVEALRRIAFLLERSREPTYRVRAFREAAAVVEGLTPDELAARAKSHSLQELRGIGKVTAAVVEEALDGETPGYLQKLEAAPWPPEDTAPAVRELRGALRGDLHTHSDWSDGGSPIEEMALAARDVGHEYVALTDHSPRLTIARGLSPERLHEQLDVVAQINEGLAPFRILTGIECDILDDGGLDQEPELLARLDVVVASVHSKLRMPRAEMTRRMLAAVANPHTDVLGHCTGRLVVGRGGKGRPESQFDADKVFAACADNGVAVEVNGRPERLDPPRRLLRVALDAGCLLAIDTDAHAPGQLDWQWNGCERAVACGLSADAARDRVVNAWPLDRLLAHRR